MSKALPKKDKEKSDKKINDYKATWSNRPGHYKEEDLTLYGDPMKGGKVIVDVITQDEYPFRLYLGSDAVEIIEKTLLDRLEELRKWRDVSLRSDK